MIYYEREAHMLLGWMLALTGRPEDGIAHIDKAIRLSPQDPAMGYFLHSIAVAHFAAGRYEEAVVWAQRSLQRNPKFYVAHGTLASSHAHLGQLDQARLAFQEMLRRNPEFSPESFKMAHSIADSAFIESWLDGLRKAGWEG